MKRFLVFITTSSYEGIDPKDSFVGDFDTLEELLAVKPDQDGTEPQQRIHRSSDFNILDTATRVWSYGDYPVPWSQDLVERRTASLRKIFGDIPQASMRRYQLHRTVAHESLFGMDGLVGTWDTIAEVIAFLNILDLTHEAVYDGRSIDLTSTDQLTLVDTATSRSQTVDYADEAVHPVEYSREYLDFAQFDQLSEPIHGGPVGFSDEP